MPIIEAKLQRVGRNDDKLIVDPLSVEFLPGAG